MKHLQLPPAFTKPVYTNNHFSIIQPCDRTRNRCHLMKTKKRRRFETPYSRSRTVLTYSASPFYSCSISKFPDPVSHRLLREYCCYKIAQPNRIIFLTVALLPPPSTPYKNTTVLDVIEKYKINDGRRFLHYMTIVYYDLFYPVRCSTCLSLSLSLSLAITSLIPIYMQN